jgi:hypothetical protein
VCECVRVCVGIPTPLCSFVHTVSIYLPAIYLYPSIHLSIYPSIHLSCRVLSRFVLSCPALSYHILSCPFVSCLVYLSTRAVQAIYPCDICNIWDLHNLLWMIDVSLQPMQPMMSIYAIYAHDLYNKWKLCNTCLRVVDATCATYEICNPSNVFDNTWNLCHGCVCIAHVISFRYVISVIYQMIIAYHYSMFSGSLVQWM